MNEFELIAKLVDALVKQTHPSIPIDIDLWDIATIAQFLKRDSSVVRERIACLPDFPQAIRLPSAKSRAHPLYKAVEVIAWTETYRERRK